MKKPSWYFLKNSRHEYDGLWTLAVTSFVFIVFLSLVALIGWIGVWLNYYSVIESADPKLARNIKPPSLKFSEISTWVGSFGGLVLGPVIAGYVARRNQIFNPAPEEPLPLAVPEKLVVRDDDGH